MSRDLAFLWHFVKKSIHKPRFNAQSILFPVRLVITVDFKAINFDALSSLFIVRQVEFMNLL